MKDEFSVQLNGYFFHINLFLQCWIFSSDAIFKMVNNIAVNVLGGSQEMQGTNNIQFVW